jgi:hypothetical protein
MLLLPIAPIFSVLESYITNQSITHPNHPICQSCCQHSLPTLFLLHWTSNKQFLFILLHTFESFWNAPLYKLQSQTDGRLPQAMPTNKQACSSAKSGWIQYMNVQRIHNETLCIASYLRTQNTYKSPIFAFAILIITQKHFLLTIALFTFTWSILVFRQRIGKEREKERNFRARYDCHPMLLLRVHPIRAGKQSCHSHNGNYCSPSYIPWL